MKMPPPIATKFTKLVLTILAIKEYYKKLGIA